MAQAVAERVQEEQYAEEEAVGGPQMLDSLQVRSLERWGGPGTHRGPGWQRLTPAATTCPCRSWACRRPTSRSSRREVSRAADRGAAGRGPPLPAAAAAAAL